ncbi:hypothetical protein BRD16_00190 [Halobacteriales archaeon SW_6_65_46]|nr:MAG: hypothetical protein BRD16_00190 [Halobacteriales archaeon SW_6_65_46]
MSEDHPDPTRIVADADVLAADLLVGGPARAVLDTVRSHSWLTLVGSEPLFDDAERLVADLADPELANDHRDRLDALAEIVDHPEGDHPGLAAAYRGDAAHLVTFDDALTSVETGAVLKQHVTVSVRPPSAFARLFDPESLWPAVGDGEYPGPDRDRSA